MRTTTWVICGVIAACGVGCGGADDSGEPGDEIAGSEGSATRWAAATTFELTRAAQDSTVPGFDLDGEVTPPGQGGPCPFTDRTDSEGRKGIDNQLAELTPILEAFVGGAVDGLIQGAVNEGRLLLLFEVVDDPPRVSVRRGDGKPYLGTDGLILDSQTFVLADETPLVYVDASSISDGSSGCAFHDGTLTSWQLNRVTGSVAVSGALVTELGRTVAVSQGTDSITCVLSAGDTASRFATMMTVESGR